MTFFRHSILSFLFIGVLVFQSCKREDKFTEPDFGYSYQPLEKGQFTIYKVDSVVYNFIVPSTQIVDTFHYQLKELLADTFSDSQNKLNFKIELYTRADENAPWTFWKVWSCKQNEYEFERVENDLRFKKLSFPVKEGSKWNGNEYLPMSDSMVAVIYSGWEYEYKNFGQPFSINGFDFAESVTVEQVDEENLIDKRRCYELYAKGVGLVYKELSLLNKQDVTSSWEIPNQVNGIRYFKKVIDYGK